jgi:hypothetical protein
MAVGQHEDAEAQLDPAGATGDDREGGDRIQERNVGGDPVVPTLAVRVGFTRILRQCDVIARPNGIEPELLRLYGGVEHDAAVIFRANVRQAEAEIVKRHAEADRHVSSCQGLSQSSEDALRLASPA